MEETRRKRPRKGQLVKVLTVVVDGFSCLSCVTKRDPTFGLAIESKLSCEVKRDHDKVRFQCHAGHQLNQGKLRTRGVPKNRRQRVMGERARLQNLTRCAEEVL